MDSPPVLPNILIFVAHLLVSMIVFQVLVVHNISGPGARFRRALEYLHIVTSMAIGYLSKSIDYTDFFVSVVPLFGPIVEFGRLHSKGELPGTHRNALYILGAIAPMLILHSTHLIDVYVNNYTFILILADIGRALWVIYNALTEGKLDLPYLAPLVGLYFMYRDM